MTAAFSIVQGGGITGRKAFAIFGLNGAPFAGETIAFQQTRIRGAGAPWILWFLDGFGSQNEFCAQAVVLNNAHGFPSLDFSITTLHPRRFAMINRCRGIVPAIPNVQRRSATLHTGSYKQIIKDSSLIIAKNVAISHLHGDFEAAALRPP